MKSIQRVCAVIIGAFGLSAASAALAQGTVYVVHGIPGDDIGLPTDLPVDVSVNGGCAIEGFVFGDILGPLGFEADTYDIEISLANPDSPCSNDPVISAPGIEVVDGENYSIVAHLDEYGAPTASVIVNDLRSSWYGSRVNVAHLAAAPRVDINLKNSWWWWTRGRTFFDVGNGEFDDKLLAAGRYDVRLRAAGSSATAFGPVPASFKRGTAYGVYAVGSLGTGSLTLLVTTLENAPPATGTAFVVHGIPGTDIGLQADLPVDVSVNGACALPGFTFGTITDGIELAPDDYDIAISLANADDPCSEAPVIEANGLVIESGKNYSIVAHLDADGNPIATAFENDLWASRWLANVNVFHTAAAPRVDVKLQRSNFDRWRRFVRDVGNGEAASTNLFIGSWDASIRPTGTNNDVFGPATLDLAGNTVYLVYAVGTVGTDSFTVLIKTTEGDSN